MSKIISFNQEAKQKLKTGIEKIKNAVGSTLGPYGRIVLIEKEHGQTHSTKDGVSVAKSIELEDPIENIGATIIKQAAIKTVEQCGDGTTTSTVLAYAMASQALDITSQPSVNVTQVKKGMETATKEVVEYLKKQSQQISDEKQIKQIATLSANGDEEIGNLVSEAMNAVGRDGIVTVEKSRTGETRLEIVEGMQFDRGYKSPYFVTDNSNMSSVLDEPYILIYDKRISAIKDLLPLLEMVSSQNKSILIIAEEIDGEALATLVMNKARGVLRVCAVKAPDFGDRRNQILEDIAVLTGATVVSADKGMTFTKFDQNWLGKARTVTITKDTTTIVDGNGTEDKIEERVNSLKSQIDKSGVGFEREKLQERLGKLLGGVAIINIGGHNDIDIEEKRDRVDDALQATKSALEEGILPGAGTALLNASKTIRLNKLTGETDDFIKGKLIIRQACSAPFKHILSNAGEDVNEYLTMSWSKNKVPEISTKRAVDAFSSGIIDPTKVIRCALQNALGVAVTLALTDTVIYTKPEKNKQPDYQDNFGM